MYNTAYINRYIPEFIDKISKWHYDRNLITGSTNLDQLKKLYEEVKELEDSILAGKDIKDDVGDIIVVLVGMLEREKLSMEDALDQAWNDIKDRKGKLINGIFIKEKV